MDTVITIFKDLNISLFIKELSSSQQTYLPKHLYRIFIQSRISKSYRMKCSLQLKTVVHRWLEQLGFLKKQICFCSGKRDGINNSGSLRALGYTINFTKVPWLSIQIPISFTVKVQVNVAQSINNRTSSLIQRSHKLQQANTIVK